MGFSLVFVFIQNDEKKLGYFVIQKEPINSLNTNSLFFLIS